MVIKLCVCLAIGGTRILSLSCIIFFYLFLFSKLKISSLPHLSFSFLAVTILSWKLKLSFSFSAPTCSIIFICHSFSLRLQQRMHINFPLFYCHQPVPPSPHHSLVSASQNQHHLLPVARVCSAPSPSSLPCWVALASLICCCIWSIEGCGLVAWSRWPWKKQPLLLLCCAEEASALSNFQAQGNSSILWFRFLSTEPNM